MQSKYTKLIDRKNPLPDYPNPQFRRDSFISLNGEWEFAIDKNPSSPVAFNRLITVPFAPETPLSGVECEIEKDDYLHYRRTFSIPAGFDKGRVLLHFEAVDQVADVSLNGVRIYHHEGGYLPFAVDCLELVEGENVLIVDVKDDVDSDIYPRGKQKREHGGIWYTPTSGIWGPVWLESVPKQVIQRIKITPQFDEKKLVLQAFFEGKMTRSAIKISYDGRFISSCAFDENLHAEIDLSSCFHPWSPEEPNLYDLEVIINEDVVFSYFAMRKFSSVEYKGKKVFGLNNKPYFLHGVLDQGYWPDGGLTCPCDEALIDDIATMKRLGFNMIRKHIKIENMRWYYHCDRLGVVVIQDFLNAGTPYSQFLINTTPFIRWKINDTKKAKLLGRGRKESQEYFEDEIPKIVDRLYNVSSIAIWTLFNEGWGQYDSVRLTQRLRGLDDTRLIDSCSGWFDQGAGDFNSRHIYFRAPKAKSDGLRILSITEFGGYVHSVPDHNFGTGKGIHYFKAEGQDALTQKFIKTFEKTLIPMIDEEGLSATVYTQLSDVEEEENGLLTYDREVIKVDEARLFAFSKKIRFKNE